MTLEQASQVVDLMTGRLSPDANVIFGARQHPGFGDTIKVMAIITGVANERLTDSVMEPDNWLKRLESLVKVARGASVLAPFSALIEDLAYRP